VSGNGNNQNPDTLPAEGQDKKKLPPPQVVVDQNTDLFLNSDAFAQLYRAASMLAASEMVPSRFRNKPADVAAAMEWAHRHRMGYLEAMQIIYPVKGQIGVEGKGLIAMINASGKIIGRLKFEHDGDNPKDKGYRCRANATFKGDDEPTYGPWITWDMVENEGWEKDGKTQDGKIIRSKWKTMPELMFMYRAAAFWSRPHMSEVVLGMRLVEEAEEIATVDRTGQKLEVVDKKDSEEAVKPAETKLASILKEKAQALNGDPGPSEEPEVVDVEPEVPGQPVLVSDKEVAQLRRSLQGANIMEERFIERMKVESLEEIPADRFEEALQVMEKMLEEDIEAGLKAGTNSNPPKVSRQPQDQAPMFAE